MKVVPEKKDKKDKNNKPKGKKVVPDKKKKEYKEPVINFSRNIYITEQ
jgi:hypothetical protein